MTPETRVEPYLVLVLAGPNENRTLEVNPQDISVSAHVGAQIPASRDSESITD